MAAGGGIKGLQGSSTPAHNKGKCLKKCRTRKNGFRVKNTGAAAARAAATYRVNAAYPLHNVTACVTGAGNIIRPEVGAAKK